MTTPDRFWSKVRKSDGCWEWQAARAYGYGRFALPHGPGHKIVQAHRWAWEQENGPLTPGTVLRHRCDNPPCARPSHLMPGTHADNVADAVSRGRNAKGEGHGLARLTEALVVLMREKYAAGARLVELSSEFGVSLAAVSLTVRGRLWREAGGPIAGRYAWRGRADTRTRDAGGRFMVGPHVQVAMWAPEWVALKHRIEGGTE